MMRKPTPIKLSEEVRNSISEQLNTQTVSRVSKSLDPEHFPVFDIPVNKKVLVYVPNHVISTESGEELLMDRPLVHIIQEGKRFSYYRCISGLRAKDANGNVIYDGSCPFCDGTDVPWELANMKILQKCNQMGLDPEDKDNKTVKAIRQTEFSSRVVKEAVRYYTFPIVVIDTVNDEGKVPVKDDKGQWVCTPMWYHISESQYTEKWGACLEGIEDEPTHPGGRFFTLNFVYDTKGKEPNKRDAARNITIVSRSFKNVDKLKVALDKYTAEWTPAKAQDTVVTNLLYSWEDLNSIADEVLSQSVDMLNLLKATEGNKLPNGIEPSDDGFKLSAPETKALSSQSEVIMDDTDLDIDTE